MSLYNPYRSEDVQLIDSLVVPFGEKTGIGVLKYFYEYRNKGIDFVSSTYKGHDKEYYEEITNETYSLKKLELIEKYGNELQEASHCFALLELAEIIVEGGIF